MSVLCLGEVWLELNAATAPELTETFRAQTGGWGRLAAGTPHWAGRRLCWPSWEPTPLAASWRPGLPGMVWIAPCSASRMPSPHRGVHRSRHRSALPCPHRRAGPWAGTAGGRPVPGSLCLLLFPPPGWWTAPAAGPPQGPCRRPGCRGALLLSSRLAQAAPYWPQRRLCARPPCSFLTGQTFSFRGERPAPPLRLPGAAHSPVCPVHRPCAADLFLQKGQNFRLYTQRYGFCRKKRPEPRSGLVSDGTNGDSCNRSATVKGDILGQLLSNDADAGSRNPDAGERSETERFNP